jgi:hypothetical protein
VATVTIYFLNTATASAPNWFGRIQEGGSAPAGALSPFGWAVGKIAITTPYYRGYFGATALSGVARAASYVDAATGPVPGTDAVTAGDSFRSDNPRSGTFVAGNWSFTLGMRTAAATTSGRIRLNVWASVNADGSAARKLTSATQVSTTTGMSTTTTTYNCLVTWAAPKIVLNNEYLFFQMEWQESTAGTADQCTAQFYQPQVVTANFLPPATGTGALASAKVTASSAGIASSIGTSVLASNIAALSGAGITKTTGSGALIAPNPSVAVGSGASSSSGGGALYSQVYALTGYGMARWVAAGALSGTCASVVASGTSGIVKPVQPPLQPSYPGTRSWSGATAMWGGNSAVRGWNSGHLVRPFKDVA